jgi:hypothetical protein
MGVEVVLDLLLAAGGFGFVVRPRFGIDTGNREEEGKVVLGCGIGCRFQEQGDEGTGVVVAWRGAWTEMGWGFYVA